MLGALAGRTKRVRLGTTVTGLPRHQPQEEARQAVTVDRLSGGPDGPRGRPGRAAIRVLGARSECGPPHSRRDARRGPWCGGGPLVWGAVLASREVLLDRRRAVPATSGPAAPDHDLGVRHGGHRADPQPTKAPARPGCSVPTGSTRCASSLPPDRPAGESATARAGRGSTCFPRVGGQRYDVHAHPAPWVAERDR